MKTIGFRWVAERNDGFVIANSAQAYSTQEDCFNDMMVHAVDKMKWNIDWSDVVESPVEPTKSGLITKEQTGFCIKCALGVYPDRIVCESNIGKYIYTYRIQPIAVSDEEAERLAVTLKWVTREDGEDGAICNITQAYTRCRSAKAWESVVDDWDCHVPSCPSCIKYGESVADIALNLHLEIQKVADEINCRVKAIEEREELADTHILACYLINGERRVYEYCLGSLNDCNHFFEDEERLTETYVLTKGDAEEGRYYVGKPLNEVKWMVCEAMKL